jgi:hypothetical protein
MRKRQRRRIRKNPPLKKIPETIYRREIAIDIRRITASKYLRVVMSITRTR